MWPFSEANAGLQVDVGTSTDKGCVRNLNEDSHFAHTDLGIWGVADGMGGHSHGDVASRLVAEAVGSVGHATSVADQTARFLDRVRKAHHQIRAIAEEGEAKTTIGTTLVSLLIHEATYTCVWAGDSRLYRLRDGSHEQVSQDHTEVAAMLAAGHLTQEEAENWPRKNVITNAVGVVGEPDCETLSDKLYVGDVFLMCSDGLTEHISDEEIGQAMGRVGHRATAQQVSDALIKETLARGAKDNVTAVVVQCTALNGGKA